MPIQMASPAFLHEERIPKKYTGDGEDVSPALTWTNVPEETQELVLICDDPDAPTSEPWVHWVLGAIPPSTTSLPEGIPRVPRLSSPAGAVQGKNSWDTDNIGYRGPMPPKGHGVHHYHFAMYALNKKLGLEPGVTKNEVLRKMKGHVLAEGRITGIYSR